MHHILLQSSDSDSLSLEASIISCLLCTSQDSSPIFLGGRTADASVVSLHMNVRKGQLEELEDVQLEGCQLASLPRGFRGTLTVFRFDRGAVQRCKEVNESLLRGTSLAGSPI